MRRIIFTFIALTLPITLAACDTDNTCGQGNPSQDHYNTKCNTK